MPLICLEGASAVGNTTTCMELEKLFNAFVIPEVNLLFERPENAHKTWYLERQVARYQIAQEKLKSFELVILDGDIFQPLSYNWCFDFEIFDQSLDFMANFYKKELSEGRIGFPDKYFYLYTNEENLKTRKASDVTRKRGNFEKHLDIVEPHRWYYESLNHTKPGYTQLIHAQNIERNIHSIIKNLPSSSAISQPLSFLEKVVDWLSTHKAEDAANGRA